LFRAVINKSNGTSEVLVIRRPNA